jgi:protein-S-isoprenylcysteine O-methyltransferase Ste14
VNEAEWLALQRAAFLAGPIAVAIALLLIVKPRPREAVAAMVAFLWQLPALLVLHLLAQYFGWWSFGVERNAVQGLPIDVWIGWAIWWGPVIVFAQRWLSLPIIVVISVGLDLATMPRLTPLVSVGPSWIAGDMAAMLLCLIPGQLAARLTRDDLLPTVRAAFHVLGWGGYMTLVIPVCVLSYTGAPLAALYHLPVSTLDWGLAAIAPVLLFVGIAATAEFASVGGGTPIPFDPPKRVVSSGPYAFTANPMQIISAFFMATLALYARSWGLALIALMFAVFDTIYATWYNRAHIAIAMPEAWSSYRGAVREWRMRWRPHIAEEAHIVISDRGPARAIWNVLWPLLSPRLEGSFRIESAPLGTLERLVYRRPNSGVEDHGIKGLARILEHGPVPLAVIGWLMRFPYLGGCLQRLSGLTIMIWRRSTVVRSVG